MCRYYRNSRTQLRNAGDRTDEPNELAHDAERGRRQRDHRAEVGEDIESIEVVRDEEDGIDH